MANGLINLQTDLTSLKYGSMPLGSDKPYVTKNIGQAPGSQIGAEISHRIDDTSRIAQMLIDKPGIKYLLNEALLQQVNVGQRVQKAQQGGKSLVGAVLQQVGSTLLNTVKIAGSTLAQVPVNGTGTHFLKGFRTDTYLQPSGPGNISAFTSFFGAGGVEGAQYALRGEVVPGVVEKGKSNFYAEDNTITSGLESLDLSKTANIYTPSNSFNKAITPEGQASRISQPDAVDGSISNLTTGSYGPDTLNIFQPTTSKYSGPETGTYLEQEKNLPTFNKNVTKEFRIKLGDQGAALDDKKAARRKNEYWFISDIDKRNPSGSLYIDQMNAIGVRDLKVDGNKEGRDLVKFRFHILTADGEEKVLYFRAFLDAFADNYSGQWNPVKYLGRAEDFQIYSGFQRKISLSFKIAAATRVEMKPLYQKMIWLASATAPTYAGEDKQFMRGTITKITVGDYIYELPGVLNSVNYAWNTEYPWEIAMLEPEGGNGDQEMQELPMIMDCSIDFTPIHTFTPETGLKKFFTAGTRPENTYV
jgi:hypothetical protein